METQNHTLTIRDNGGATVRSSIDYSADSATNISNTVDEMSTLEEDVDIIVDNIVAFFISSDQNLTLKTNSTGDPDQTISIVADKPLWWNTDLGANPLTDDITKLYFINAGAVAAILKCGFIVTDEA